MFQFQRSYVHGLIFCGLLLAYCSFSSFRDTISLKRLNSNLHADLCARVRFSGRRKRVNWRDRLCLVNEKSVLLSVHGL